MDRLKATYFWTMAVLVTVFYIILSFCAHAGSLLLGRRDGRASHRINTWWGRTIIRFMPGWKVSVYEKENVPTDGEVLVVVGNHESMSDICAIYHLDLQFRWLSKEEVFRIFGVGAAMRWAGYVSIKRGVRESHAQAMVESAQKIRGGASMFFFPEGTRSPDGVVKPFKNGAFKLARDEKVRILPVAIHGAGSLLPKGRAVPGKAHVKIKVLPPIAPPREGEDLDAFAEKVRQDIIKAHATLV